jgi:hypothetical protein
MVDPIEKKSGDEESGVKVYEQCPVCKSKKRLAASKIQSLKDKTALHRDSFKDGLMFQIPLMDPNRPPSIIAPVMKINVLYIFWDVCAECGNIYCTKFECVETPAQMEVQKQPLQRGR